MSGIAITFPSSPSEGQSYLAQNGFTYIYDSQKNRWKRGGEFVRAPKVLSYAGVAVTTTGAGIITGPTGSLVYNIPEVVVPNSTVGVDSFKAYRTPGSYPNYTEVQVSISSAFSSVAYAATFAGTTHTIPSGTLSGDTTYYLRARQFVGSDASAAGVGAISGYSANIVSFATTSTYIDTPVIVSISGSTDFPVYQIGSASTTLPATVTYTGSGVGNLEQVDWRVTGPRIPTSTGDTALAEIGIGTHSSSTLANALVLALPFSGATGVGITDDVNNAIRTASGASAGTTIAVTTNGGIGTTTISGLALTSHFYNSAAFFDNTDDYLSTNLSSSFAANDFTIECWIYPFAFGDDSVVGERNNSYFGFNLYNNNFRAYFNTGFTTSAITSKSFSPYAWYHVAMVRRGSIGSLYINGSLEGSTVISGTMPSQTISVGSYYNAYYYSGYMQDLKIYTLAKYTESFTPPLPTYGTISYTTGITNVGVDTTAFYQSTGDIPLSDASSPTARTVTTTVTNSGTSDYVFSGDISGNDPSITVYRGDSITFNVNASGHPFWIQTVSGAYSSGNVVTQNITNNGTESGTITWIPQTAGTYYYVCQNHSAMAGSITVSEPASSLVLAMPMNRTFGFQDINGSIRALTSGAVPYPNNGSTWSDDLSAAVTLKTPTAGFDVDFTTGRSEGNGGLTFTPTTPIQYGRSVEVYDNNNVTKSRVNSGSFVQHATSSWVGVATGSGTITSMYFERTDNPSFDAGFQGIRVDGVLLVDDTFGGFAKTVGLGTTSTANAPSHPRISAIESKWYDGAAYFDGNDNLRVNYPSSEAPFTFPGDFTLEFWINSSSSTNGTILDTRVSGSPVNWILDSGANGNSVRLIKYSNGTTIFDAGIISTNKWTHVAFSRTGTTLNGFINGVLTATTTASGELTASNTYYLCVGSDNRDLGYYTGYLQDLKVYKGFAKYTADFTPPQPICGFSTDISTQTGFTTTTATGALLSSVVGLGSTSTLAFDAGTTYAGITSITSSSGITTLTDPYAQNLVLALPLADITGVGNSFTNDRNTQIRSVSLVGGGSEKTGTNTGGVSLATTSKWYNGSANFSSGRWLNYDFAQTWTSDFTIEGWAYRTSSGQQRTIYDFVNGVGNYGLIGSINTSDVLTAAFYSTTSSASIFGQLTGTTTPLNTWFHWAVVRQGTSYRLYQDGVLTSSSTSASSPVATNYHNIGERSDDATIQPFIGYLQDFRVYVGTAKYTTNFTPPPPMFGDYVRSTPNKVVFTPGSDYVLEAKNTSGEFASSYSATRQWGTKPEGGIYDPYAGNLVLAIPGGAVGGATSTYDVTGQIRYETPTATYVNAGIVTYSNSLGIGTYGNRTVSIAGTASVITTQSKYYGRSMFIPGSDGNTIYASGFTSFSYTSPFTIEFWLYPISTTANNNCQVFHQDRAGVSGTFVIYYTNTFALNASGITGSYTITQSQWQHIAYSRDVNGNNRLFVNGVQVLSTNGTVQTAAGYDHFMMGKRLVSDAFSARGDFYIQDVRVYSGICKYTSNFTPPNQIYLT